MSVKFALGALLLLAACGPSTPQPSRDPSSPDYEPKSDDPFPTTGPQGAKRPASGRCYSDVDCRANGMECLQEGKGKGGTCVRMDPAMAPNGLPSGPCVGGPCPR